MRTKITKILAVILGFAITMLCGLDEIREIRADQSDVDNAQTQVDNTKQEIANLKNELQNIASNITDTKTYILELDQKLAGYTQKLFE